MTACTGVSTSVGTDAATDSAPLISRDPYSFQYGQESTDDSVSADSTQGDVCYAVTVNTSGEAYCVGNTYGDLQGTNDGNGTTDGFIMKLSVTGEMVWIRQLNDEFLSDFGSLDTTTHDWLLGVAVDSEGNVIATGYTSGDLGETSGGDTDIFVVKLSADGDLQWIKQFGATTKPSGGSTAQGDNARSVAVDSEDNIYIGGHSYSDFSEANGNTSSRRDDIVIAKLDSDGTLLWGKNIGATTATNSELVNSASDGDLCKKVLLDSDENPVCVGYTISDFVTANSGRDGVVVKLDKNDGSLLKVFQLSDDLNLTGVDVSGNEDFESAAFDASGNLIIAGNATGDLKETNNSGFSMDDEYFDIFVLKLNAEFTDVDWVTQITSTPQTPDGGTLSGDENVGGVVVTSDNKIILGGRAMKDFAVASTNDNTYDLFFAVLSNSDGSVVQGYQIDHSNNERCYDFVKDVSDNLYCAGYTNGSLFETSSGSSDAIVMKLNSDLESDI